MIVSFLLPENKLTQEKDEMFALFKTHFEGVSWEQFEQDLSRKDWVILLRENQILKGFSTLQFYETKLNGESIRIIYSGDTITDPSMWSSPALGQAWITAVQKLHQDRPERLYWLLISSGYRTYRFLSIFAEVFYPHYQQKTPPEMVEFIHTLARSQFQDNYDSDRGIIRFPQPQILRPHLRDIPPEKLKDPHVAFFLEKNPGYIDGDELVCLAEFTQTNLTRAGLRLWKSNYPLSISL